MSGPPSEIGRPDQSELDAVRANVRAICEKFGIEYWQKTDEARAFPEEFFRTIGEAGYLGALLPAAWGGSEAGPGVASVIVEEINRFGADAAAVNAQMAICGTLARHGTEEQKRAHLAGIAAGRVRLLTVAATEPDSGADMSKLDSRARRDGGDWIIDARKILISMAEHTDLLLVLVRTPEGPTLFLIDVKEARPHLEIHPIALVANRHATTLSIDDLRLPDSARIGPAGSGLSCLMDGFSVRRVLAASESIGNARFFIERSVEHAKMRQTFGRAIGQNQGVQYPIALSYAKTEAADLTRWDAVRLIERGEPAGGRSAIAKILASEAAWEAGRMALTTFGGWGLASEYHVERKLRDASVFVFNNMLLSYVAEQVLGLPKAF
jgi:acyl-CoA dehydrogenase